MTLTDEHNRRQERITRLGVIFLVAILHGAIVAGTTYLLAILL